MEERPWSSNSLRRLGVCIRDDLVIPGHLPGYDDVMLWYNDLAAHVQQRIMAIQLPVSLMDIGPIEVTSRAKTIDTLRDKLRRDRGMALPAIQDIAGVRVDADMTLGQQTMLAAAIAEEFDMNPEEAVKDLRDGSHSGYRAVHVWLRLDGARVEVQVRTLAQSEWANMYEAMGDAFGRNIRYGVIPEDKAVRELVVSAQKVSRYRLNELEKIRDEQPDPDFVRALGRRLAEGSPEYESWEELERTFHSTRERRSALEAKTVQELADVRYLLKTVKRGGQQ